FQFAMSLVFILGVVIVTKQYKYALNYDLGFQKKNIIEIPLQQVNIDLLRTELERLPDVESISMSSSAPGGWSNSSSWVRLTPESDSVEVSQLFTDSHFLDCLEIELIAGKNFLKEPEQNRDFVIVNETFTQEFGFATPIDAVGQSVVIHKDEYVTIVGVVKDFNHQPLREKINPFFFRYDTDRFLLANVKISSNDIVKTLFGIEKVWETVSPESRFDFYFLDDKVEQSLIGLLTLIKIFGFLAMLAIVISCLGLLAVVLSVSEGRIKEMGLRKVMGASSFNLAYTLSRGFIKLIGIAILIATPFTYFLFEKVILRLQHYRSAIGIGDVLLGITILLVLLVITIGGQTMKVARVNPVETLKSE
ncbi:MAG: ABC transporter permease, partial [Cyclobacteriaceae bacterium]